MSRRAGIQLCYPFEEGRLRKWNTNVVITQPKLDGERCRAIVSGGNVQLISSEMNEILSVPHLVDELSHLPDIELDGELYMHGEDFSMIHSRVGRTVNLHEDFARIQYHVFDVINDESQAMRIGQLADIFQDHLTDNSHIQLVNSVIVTNELEKIYAQFRIFVEEGYEGIIIRHPWAPYKRKRSTNIMKFKPKKSDIYMIVDCVEEVSIAGVPKNSLGALTCIGLDDTRFNVGTGFTAQQRKDLWEMRNNLSGQYIRVNYQSITPKHVPRFPVFVELLTMFEVRTKED